MRYNGYSAEVRDHISESRSCAEYDSVQLLPNSEAEERPIDELLKIRIERLARDIHECAAICDSFKKASFFGTQNCSRWTFVLTRRSDRLLRGSSWNEDLRQFVDTFDYHCRSLNDTIMLQCGMLVKDMSQHTKATNDRVNEIKAYFEPAAGAGPYRKAGGESDPDGLALNLSEDMWEEVGPVHQGSIGDIVRSNAEIFDKKFALQKAALRPLPDHTMLPVSDNYSPLAFLLT